MLNSTPEPNTRNDQTFYRKVVASVSFLILSILTILVLISYKARDQGPLGLAAENNVLSGVKLNPPFKLPVLRWHDTNENSSPLFQIPRSLSALTQPNLKYPANPDSTMLQDRKKEGRSVSEQKLLATLQGLHVSEKNIANIMTAMREKLVAPNVVQKAAMMAAADSPLENSSIIIDGGEAQESDEPDLLDMIAVLEGLHVSSQVIDDSVNAVRAHLVLPKDIIRIATAVKEQQVKRFLDAQENMDR